MKTQYYCYAIKITTSDSFRGVKIGECGDTDRVENLSRKYEEDKKNVKTKVIVSDIPLPCNNKKRLNDKTIHKRIISDGLFVKQDSSVLKEITGADDGKDEFFRLKDDVVMSDDEIAKYLRDTINDLGKDEKNFTANIEKPLRYRKNNEKKQKHYVDEYYINIFFKYLGNIGKEKTFFLIGQFHEQFVSYIARNNTIYILYDSEDDKCKYIDVVKNNLYYFYDLDEVLKMCKKFDYIIANPPYAMGNELTKTVVENVEFGKYINLMPASKYKGKELYKYVESIEKVEDNFDDACVGESLTITIMSKTADTFSSFDELEMCKFDERFRKFYENNSKKENNINYTFVYKISKSKDEIKEALNKINSDTDFFISQRTADNGVHIDDGATDRKWNLGYNISDTSIFNITKWTGGAWGTQGGFIQFNKKVEKDNFTNFWYRNGKNGLMNKLIKGLNKTNGTIELAIPRVDWSHPWTDEEILKEYGYTEEEIKEILE